VSLIFELVEDKEKLAAQLIEIFDAAERDINLAAPLFELEGQRLELLLRNLPLHQEVYSSKYQNMKGIVKWLENHKAKLEGIHTRNYMRGARALSATDQRTLIGGEADIIELNQLIIEATILQNKFGDIVEAFKQMGWMLGHITKLRVASIEDTII
jgi:hypothetical protein